MNAKANRFDVTTPLTWAEDDALSAVSKVLNMPKAGVMRLGLLAILKEYAPEEAAKMLRNRITKAACLFFALAVPFISVPSRRPTRMFSSRPPTVRLVRKSSGLMAGQLSNREAV